METHSCKLPQLDGCNMQVVKAKQQEERLSEKGVHTMRDVWLGHEQMVQACQEPA